MHIKQHVKVSAYFFVSITTNNMSHFILNNKIWKPYSKMLTYILLCTVI